MSVTRQAESLPAGKMTFPGEAHASDASRVPTLIEDAGELLRAGQSVQALVAYRQVLEIDPARIDVAQRVAWMEREQRALGRVRDFRLTLGLTAFMLALVGSWVTVREARLKQSVADLPALQGDSDASVRARLAAMDSLLAENSLWIGGLTLRREREHLHAHEGARDASRSRREDAMQVQREQQMLTARAACTRAQLLLEDGLVSEARVEFAHALNAAPASSDLGIRIQAELDAIDEHLRFAADHSSTSTPYSNPYPAGGR